MTGGISPGCARCEPLQRGEEGDHLPVPAPSRGDLHRHARSGGPESHSEERRCESASLGLVCPRASFLPVRLQPEVGSDCWRSPGGHMEPTGEGSSQGLEGLWPVPALHQCPPVPCACVPYTTLGDGRSAGRMPRGGVPSTHGGFLPLFSYEPKPISDIPTAFCLTQRGLFSLTLLTNSGNVQRSSPHTPITGSSVETGFSGTGSVA